MLLAVRPTEPNPRVWAISGALVHAGVEPIVCHVVMRSTTRAANESDGAPANPEELAIVQELRRSLQEAWVAAGRTTPIHMLHGDPGQRICEYAAYADCDLIVLGTHSARTALATWVRGSVTRYVVGNFRRSVLVIGD